MIINLIKSRQMFSLMLPQKIKGQYWLSDIDINGYQRELISVEAINGEWVIKSNNLVSILNSKNEIIDNTVLTYQSFFNLLINNTNERVIIFAEVIDDSRYIFKKIFIRQPTVFNIGRNEDNQICYNNKFVSGKHARITYDGSNWLIQDLGSKNGTFVNEFRAESKNLQPGDLIYIMGLRIIVGQQFLAINNPDRLLKINSSNLGEYIPQQIKPIIEKIEIPKKIYFFRSPRFHREIENDEMKIDPPPQVNKNDTVPMALMLGPSLTMGITSLSTGLISLNNVISNGGEVTQALPTLMMSLSMLLGTVLWPILTKKYEKKNMIKNEKKRQEKYLAYLDSVRDEIKRKSKEQSDILNENLVTLEECSNRIANVKTNLWERALGHSDFLQLRLGVGNLPLNTEIRIPDRKFTMDDDNLQDAMFSLGAEPKQLLDVPISISLVDNTVIGIYGEYVLNLHMMKALILQMVSLHSYDELKIILMCDKSDIKEWDFVRFIPHFWSDDKDIRFLATNQDEVKELSAYMEKNILIRTDSRKEDYTYSPYYVIISTSKVLCEKCESIKKLLKYKNNVGFSILLSAPELKDLPKETKIVIKANGKESKLFDPNDTSGKDLMFCADNVNETIIDSIGFDLANIELDLSSQRYLLPSMLTFLEMFNVGKIEHLNSLTRWKENNPTITLQTPVGIDSYGNIFNLDLHEKYHGPHGLVAGMTGSGKSEFIITYILSLAVNYHPDEVAFILIDYKGGGLTGAFEDEDRGIKLPHLAGTITNLDGAAVKRSLISIQSELRRRQTIFNEARKISNEGTMDIYKYQQLYRDRVVSEPVPHLFIISDEFAELKTQQPEFMEQLISAARIGRSLGIHLILATQKPSGVVDDQIWSNSKFRVCLKVQEKADSQDMIKCPDAAELSQTGRFYLQVGFNELFALGQSAWCGAEYIPTETIEKAVDNSIQVVDNLGRTLMKVSPVKKKVSNKNKVKQVVAIVKYLSDLAIEEKIKVKPLWLDPIPSHIYVDKIEKKYDFNDDNITLNPVIGEYDDPFNQNQGILTVPFSKEGNCLVYGSTGNGKTTFLTTLCYSLIKNHTPEEVNIYIIDFGSETLKVFEKAPHVGGVIVSADEEKTVNFFKMIDKEIEIRKSLFSEYGGDYDGYCKNSGDIAPNIVILLNNYAGFIEQYEDYQEEFNYLSREGVKYGIYFAITTSNTNDVRYKTQQNFKIMLTMQLNDRTDYPVVVGKTDGLVPSKFKGRGLVALDRVYEFQTAYCKDVEDIQDYLREYSQTLNENASHIAKSIPVLPEYVDIDYVKSEISNLKNVPVGVNKNDLNIYSINIENKVVFPIIGNDIYEKSNFVIELVKILNSVTNTYVIDSEKMVKSNQGVKIMSSEYEEFVIALFNEMVIRNNTYKDSNLDLESLKSFDERVYVLVGFNRFYEQLTTDSKDKLNILLEKAESFYKLHFIIIENSSLISSYSYNTWYKLHIAGADGIWIGDGVADQYVLKVNKITSEMYKEIDDDYGYVITKNKGQLVKLLSSNVEEDD